MMYDVKRIRVVEIKKKIVYEFISSLICSCAHVINRNPVISEMKLFASINTQKDHRNDIANEFQVKM